MRNKNIPDFQNTLQWRFGFLSFWRTAANVHNINFLSQPRAARYIFTAAQHNMFSFGTTTKATNNPLSTRPNDAAHECSMHGTY